ncbi:hypothetical protein Y032_0036g3243 [Ancylostoma ceylanicum]|uniref:Peptidase A2 domain-containing protein n=1 Tax=Ancylostoma ceylanicum TaxID=53326 RepID=A0A016UL36_9BILA|nr:hypothetical protein Y032_0036g3243 [Ancylostoma ceylanicum]
MAEIKVFKTKITNACALLRSNESAMNSLDEPFTFPATKAECEAFIRQKTAELNHLQRTISNAKQLHDSHVNAAIANITSRQEAKEREKLMVDLNKHLETDSNDLEISSFQWINTIEFRKDELAQQALLIACSEPSTSNNQRNCCQGERSTELSSRRDIRVRRPLLEVPTYSGQYREFSSFWSVFESLIHNDTDLTNTEKFLFLKQALKGKAASTIHSIPVIGEKYHTAVELLRKHFDKSACIADILINEIERLPRAHEDPSSCREIFDAVSTRLIHLEQTGVPMNADRIWRRMILCKFPESICNKVIQKESKAGSPFNVNDVMTAVDDIITLRETTSLTTRTLFGNETQSFAEHNDVDNGSRRDSAEKLHERRLQPLCLCGEAHSPRHCAKYTTPESRRAEARRQNVCWKCFEGNHKSKDCKTLGPCPKCSEPHHSSLCHTRKIGSEAVNVPQSGFNQPLRRNNQQQSSRLIQPQLNRSDQPHQRSCQDVVNVQANQNCSSLHDVTAGLAAMPNKQYILQTASTLIFNEEEQDYQPVTMLLDSGAQRSFIKAQLSSELNLPVIGTTSLTTAGMGELLETFKSNKVPITLKGIHNSKKLQRLPIQTKEKLIAETRTAYLSEEDQRFIKDRKIVLAQRDFNSSVVSPDLLIGQDLLSSIIEHSRPTLILPSGLILTPTIFGYTPSGASEVELPNDNVNSESNSINVATSLVATANNDNKMSVEKESLGCLGRIQEEKHDSNVNDRSISGTRKYHNDDFEQRHELLPTTLSNDINLKYNVPEGMNSIVWNSKEQPRLIHRHAQQLILETPSGRRDEQLGKSYNLHRRRNLRRSWNTYGPEACYITPISILCMCSFRICHFASRYSCTFIYYCITVIAFDSRVLFVAVIDISYICYRISCPPPVL